MATLTPIVLTTNNDTRTVERYGLFGNIQAIDGLAGTDTLNFDRLLRSRFTITRDSATGVISVDSVAGASSTFNYRLTNVEKLSFNEGKDILDLTTYFDTTAPTVSTFSPADGASSVAVASNIVLTFSEAIQKGTGLIEIRSGSATGTVVESFNVATSTLVTISGSTLTINPASNLTAGTHYFVTFASGTVKDTSGNSFAGTSVYDFTTIVSNHSPTGSVTITGAATQGETLTATNSLADTDGLGTISYQWKAAGVNISGATSSTYTLTQAEVGKAITVVASYTDLLNTTESVVSSATASVANTNDAPTGSVTITGTATQGQTLTASNTLADVDGLGSVSYQWKAAGTNISGATSSTYVLTQAEVGKAITVVASYTDLQSTAESVASSATSNVANINDAPTGSVTITGTAMYGQTLTAANTLADADGLGSVSYQWKAAGTNISGATASTYTLTQAEVGKVITVVASYTDLLNTVESVASSATSTVANFNNAPTGSVTITGTASQGETLTAANSLDDVDGLGTISYQWKAAGTNISGATGATYTLTQAEVGKTITVVASYTDLLDVVESVASSATISVANINDAPTGSVTITGNATQGQTLTAANTLADVDGLGSVSYQWKAAGTNISGATSSTYVLTQAEVGKAITVVASYNDVLGTPESVASSATSSVVNVNDAPTGSVTITGNATQGQTLTAANTLADADGLGSISYQWKAAGTNISGATSSTYVLTQAEVGKAITVVASYNDVLNTAESVASSATLSVANTNDAPTGSVTITGTATQGQTLTASNSLADVDGMGSVNYQWKAAGTNISGATSATYTLTQAEVGKAITVVASYNDVLGTAESVASSGTSNVANVNDAPTGAVTITGASVIGQTLTAANTLLDADGLGTISYQWKAAGTNISGATSSTYTLTDSELGKTITVVASYTDLLNSAESVSSNATSTVIVVTGANFAGDTGINTLTGDSGNDTLTGAGAVDIMDGREGSDLYLIAAAAEHTAKEITDTGTSGSDEVRFNATAAGTLTLFAGDTGIEKVTIGTGVASDAVSTGILALSVNAAAVTNALVMKGNAGANTLTGTAFADTLDGGAGVDKLTGGLGNDLYYSDIVATTGAVQDTITEAVSGGTDSLVLRGTSTNAAALTLTMAANLENIDASGTGSSKLNFTGNILANTITGNAADNILNGLAGIDTLIGGAGNDTYVVDNTGDVVTEGAGAGTDLVQVAIATAAGTYTLGSNLENATLTSTVAYSLTGNTLDNTLTGNAAINTLTGGEGNDTLNGAAGADILVGGAGNDIYVIDNIADVVTEGSDAGTDTIQSSITKSIAALANVEKLTLTGTTAINATGNSGVNTLTGNTGANVLDGGAGADTMVGGAGADTYVVDDADDVVTETSALTAGGIDLVQSSISYTLGSNLEKLTLTGSSAINATGNELANTLTGNAAANTLDGGSGIDILIGGAGDDIYYADLLATGALQDTVTEAANAGTDTLILRGTSTNTTVYTQVLATTLENLDASNTVSSKLNFTGNALANRITGNAADNLLNGLVGADTLIGGAGNDTYVVDNLGDVVTEGAGAGTDLVQVSIATAGGTFTLGSNIENAILTSKLAYSLTGNTLDNTLTGNAAINTLTGGEGNDTLNGAAGADILVGGAGNDIYVIDNIADVVTEGSDAGTDTIQSSITKSIAALANVENLTLTGTAALNATGNSGVNTLTGNTGANVLDGGAGADTMIGGDGADTYVVDDADDVVNETSALTAGGIDLVQSSISYTLGSNLEKLTLTGSNAINGTGNSLANTLTGNAAANTLDGGIGGIDTLIGGAGDDIYYADLLATGVLQDIITEAANAGTDTLNLRGTSTNTTVYTQVLAATLENLDASDTGTSKLNLTGNVLANLITGNDADNVINGGLGTDTMNGGAGADVYVVTAIAEHSAAEFADTGSSGQDQIRFAATAASTLTLFAGDTGIESVVIGTGVLAAAVSTGTAALNVDAHAVLNGLSIIGNAGANSLIGTGFADTLAGGLGNDTLTGGSGADNFVFDKAANATTNKDTITDFESGTDYLQFSKAVFAGLGISTGTLADSQFYAGTAAHDADDRLIYNATSGALLYDADGSGSGAAVQVALLGLTMHPVSLFYSDFQIIV